MVANYEPIDTDLHCSHIQPLFSSLSAIYVVIKFSSEVSTYTLVVRYFVSVSEPLFPSSFPARKSY